MLFFMQHPLFAIFEILKRPQMYSALRFIFMHLKDVEKHIEQFSKLLQMFHFADEIYLKSLHQKLLILIKTSKPTPQFPNRQNLQSLKPSTYTIKASAEMNPTE